jgi:6-pyruvoyltetrahydropterin/6-carboxytetrahydropterin synthase
VEILLESNFLDNGQMVYDFGLMKTTIKDLIDSFDHAITLWNKDNPKYLEFAKKFSERWIILPVNPSAEQFSRVFFLMVDRVLNLTVFQNNEKNIKVNSVIVHETDTGYAQCFREDAYNFENMGEINLKEIIFSEQIKKEWSDYNMWNKIIKGENFINPKPLKY